MDDEGWAAADEAWPTRRTVRAGRDASAALLHAGRSPAGRSPTRPVGEQVAEVLVVVGACGGVGTSTFAALLARQRAAVGSRVALVDLDHGHGGVEVLLGIESRPGARWSDLHGVRGTLSAQDLDGVLPRWEGVEVLSAGRDGGPPPTPAVRTVWSALVAGCRTVVADVPARMLRDGDVPDDRRVITGVAGSVERASRSDLLLVTGQDVVGVAAGLGVRSAIGPGRAQLVLRRRRGARLAPEEVAEALELPLLAMLPHDRGLAGATDRGLGPVVSGWSRLGRAVRRAAAGSGHG